MPGPSGGRKESSGRTTTGEVFIKCPAQCEVNHGQGPTKYYRVREAYVFPEKIFLKGLDDVKASKGTELFIRCLDLSGTGNFVALATVTRITLEGSWAEWKLLDSDRMQLEEAFQNAKERAA